MDTHAELETAKASERPGLASTGQTYALAADVLFAIGGVSLVTGLVLVLVAPDNDGDASVTWHPTGYVGPEGATFGISGRW